MPSANPPRLCDPLQRTPHRSSGARAVAEPLLHGSGQLRDGLAQMRHEKDRIIPKSATACRSLGDAPAPGAPGEDEQPSHRIRKR